MSSIANGHGLEAPHIFVFDYMRTRSHLFWRWMSTHPALYVTYHRYFMSGFLGASTILKRTRNSEARQADHDFLLKSTPSDETWEDSNRMLKEDIAEAEAEGKRLFTNEHVMCIVDHDIQIDLSRKRDDAFPPFNCPFPDPLAVPESLLEQFTPIILIRHPVLQVDSVYRSMLANTQCRPGDEDFEIITVNRQSRLVFEYFRLTRGGRTPIVVDGEDVLWRTHELGDKLCTALGLPADGFKDHWDPLPDEQKHPNWFIQAMTTTMTDSTGIERPDPKPAAPDLERFVEKWTKLYGATVAEQLKERVEDGMPHYQHMVQYKL